MSIKTISHCDGEDHLEREVKAGVMVKEYLAADGLQIELQTLEGHDFRAHMKLHGDEPFDGTEEFAYDAHPSASHMPRKPDSCW